MNIMIWGFITILIVFIIILFITSKPRTTYNPSGIQLDYLIEALCEAAEKWYPEKGMGQKKLQWVMDMVRLECETYGTEYPANGITSKVETYVHDVINKQVDVEAEIDA